MKRLVLGLVFLAGCSSSHGTPTDEPVPCGRYGGRQLEIPVQLSGDFTDGEKNEIETAAGLWAIASGSHVQWVTTTRPVSMKIIRVYPENPLVLERDRALALAADSGPAHRVLGWYQDTPRAIYLVPDRLSAEQHFYRLVMHEMGHAIGLRWTNGDCHNPHAQSMMAATYVDSDFTESDMYMCKVSGFCP